MSLPSHSQSPVPASTSFSHHLTMAEEGVKTFYCFPASTFSSTSLLPTHAQVALPSLWMVPHICPLKLERWQ